MSDEHVRLVAKIQHFYEVMMHRLNEMEDAFVSCENDLERLGYREKSVELNRLTFEYAKTFETFLYKEPHEKR